MPQQKFDSNTNEQQVPPLRSVAEGDLTPVGMTYPERVDRANENGIDEGGEEELPAE
jgi:hypothetical protein